MDDLNNNNEYLVHDAPVSIDELTSDLKGELGATKTNGFYAGDRGFMGAEQGPMEPEFVPYPPYGEFPPYPPYEEFPPYPMEGEFPPYPPMPGFFPPMTERPVTAKEQADMDELENRLFGAGSLPVDRHESVVQFVDDPMDMIVADDELDAGRFMEPEELPEERSIFGRLFRKKEKPIEPPIKEEPVEPHIEEPVAEEPVVQEMEAPIEPPVNHPVEEPYIPEMYEPHEMPEIDDTIEELAAELEKVKTEEPVVEETEEPIAEESILEEPEESILEEPEESIFEEPVPVEEVKAENIEEIFIDSETGDVVDVEEAESFDEAEEFEEIEEIEMDSQGFRAFTKEQLAEMANPVAGDDDYVELENKQDTNSDEVLFEAIDPADKPAVEPKQVNEVFEGIGTSSLDKIPEKYIFKL